MSRELFALLALAATALVAGCVGGGDDNGGDQNNDTPADNATAGALPPPIEASEEVTGSADPVPFTGAAPLCETPSAQCFRYPFELNGTATISVSLTWTVPANDFDVYIFEDGEQLTTTEGGSSPPGTEEAFDFELEAGSYEVVVTAFAVSQDTFTLSATFA